MSEQRISIDGQDIAFTASEGTGRTVVFVHRNSSSARTWHPLLAGPFGERFRCLALDLPGHGGSAPAKHPDDYSLPGFAAVLAGFIEKTDAEDAVIVGWSLGGHIVLEAAPQLPEAAGFVIFGAPPIGTIAADFATAFLPHPAVNVGFTAEVDTEAALSYAVSFLAPGSTLPTDELVADILATEGAFRTSLLTNMGAGKFADEVEIVAQLTRPIAMLHGERDQLVRLDYLRGLTMPTLWRGEVQVFPGVGHAPHVEAPQDFAETVAAFVTDLG